MAGPPRCQMILKTANTEAAHALVRAVLGETGYEDLRTRRSDNGFEVTGIRGKSAPALMFQLIPFGKALGIAGRTRVRASCQRSLSDDDDRLHAFLRVVPVRELDDDKEVWAVTQGPEELLGDSLQARRCLGRIIAAFEERDFAPTHGDVLAFEDDPTRAHRPREDVRERIRRGNHRRNVRIALGACFAALVYIAFWYLDPRF